MQVLRMSRVGLPRAVDGLERIRTTTLLGRAVLPLAAIAVGLVGCKEGAASTQNKVTEIVGMAAIDSVRLGRTYRYTIELRDASGNRVTDRTVAWSSLNPNVAAVDANGTVTGVAIGATVIVAQVNGATAHATMNVQPLVNSVVLFPSSTSVPIGTPVPLTVVVSDKDGLALSGRLIAFSTSNPGIATVNGAGVVVGASLGRAIITAQAVQDQVSGTATIDIVPAPAPNVAITPAGSQPVSQGLTLQLAATLKDASGNPLTGRTVSWSTSNASIATVSSTGLETGVALARTSPLPP